MLPHGFCLALEVTMLIDHFRVESPLLLATAIVKKFLKSSLRRRFRAPGTFTRHDSFTLNLVWRFSKQAPSIQPQHKSIAVYDMCLCLK
ncbi:hypothetical protein CEXT_763171 [Caerostris extrusa]|uniref:Uncharacterized protein n=1 Tax=Caerostris extrusa TaxID=172846 RepID=A0AAV4MRS9_CAEEX|nr:hypothetical protein CEXT_763171 [Caerostris extrusa]